MVGKNGRQSVAPSRGVKSSARGGSDMSRRKGMTINERAALQRALNNRDKDEQNPTRKTPAKKMPAQKPQTPQKPQNTKAVERKVAAAERQKAQEMKAREALKGIRTDEDIEGGNGYIWVSLAIFFIAGFLLLGTISYLMYWEVDAPRAFFSNYFDSAFSNTENWAGRLGAISSNYIIGGWFGVSGVLLSLFFFMLGLRALRVDTLRYRRSMPALLAIMIVSSLILAHIFGTQGDVFGSGWGGSAGISVDRWLRMMIGDGGSALLIFFLLVAILYYSFTGWVVRAVRHFRWYGAKRQEKRLAARKWEAEQLHNTEEEVVENDEVIELEKSAAANVDEKVEQEDVVVQDLPKDQEEVANEEKQVEEKPVEEIPIVQEAVVEDQQEVVAIDEIFTPTIIALEGGILGYMYGYSDAGEALYYYYDNLSAFSSTAIVPDATTSPQPMEVEEEEEQIPEEVFTVTNRDITIEDPVGVDSQDGEVSFIVEQPTEEPLVVNEREVQSVAIPEVEYAKKEIGFEVESVKEEEMSAIENLALYDPTAELPNYKCPSVDLLQQHSYKIKVSEEELKVNKDRIIHTLQTFGIKIKSIKATIGPTVTLYEIVPEDGVRISKIKNLENDIALALAALGIRIIAPIPGKGTIGIEVPNTHKETVSMHSVICSTKFAEINAELPIALGKTIANETFVIDLAKMPHLLVAGATGQGKSVGLNAIITSLLYKKHPSELKFVLVDPKKVELTLYSYLEKHFLAKMEGEDEAIITENQKVVYTLNSICLEMDSRYDLLKAAQVRNIVEYNNKFIHRRLNPEKGHRFLPYFVVIIDEFADLIMTAGREVETPIARIAQLARAVGIHLIIATQRPTTNIITGMIKANFPARIAFKVTSMIDSRTILDSPGANQLIGRGDMLVHTGSEMTRVQCAFIDTPEVEEVVKSISAQRGYTSAYELPEFVPESESTAKEVDMTKRDPLFSDVARFVVATQTGSASTIQRKFAIGFNRAGRIVDQLEATGIVGPQVGSKARQVLIQDPVSLEMIIDD